MKKAIFAVLATLTLVVVALLSLPAHGQQAKRCRRHPPLGHQGAGHASRCPAHHGHCYWHIGDTTMRLRAVTNRKVIG